MKTLVVFDDKTKEILCCIPDEGGAICKKGINFSLYEGTEPIFIEKQNGIVLAENKFMLNLGKSE